MNFKQILKFGVLLTLVCVIAAGALAVTYNKTKPVIDQRKKEIEKEALQSVFPQGSETKTVKKDKEIYQIVYDKDRNELGVAFKISAAGYGGAIDILVGVAKDGKVSAIKILNQNETPGLGAKVTEPKFYAQFKGKAEKELVLKKDGGTIEAITAATISSRAVTNSVQEAVNKVKKFYREQENESKK